MATNQRERAKRSQETRDKRPYAIARYIRISPTKVGIVLDLIRGKDYQLAVNILTHTNKSACLPVLKLLNSAAANAENNQNIPKDTLYVAECWTMQGPTMKRMMPRAKGRGDRILKKTSHIQIILDERITAPAPSKAKAGVTPAPGKAKEVKKVNATEKPKAGVAKAAGADSAPGKTVKQVASKPKTDTKPKTVVAKKDDTAKPKATVAKKPAVKKDGE